MSNKHPHSLRTRLTLRAYLVGYQESTGPLAGPRLNKRARRFIDRTFGSAPAPWAFGLMMVAYRQGWRDKAQGKPCQPWPAGESEEA